MFDRPGDRRPDLSLSAPLRQAVERVVSRPVPADSLRRALQRAEQAAGGADRPRYRRRAMLAAVGVAAVAAALLWSWQPPVSWAQVAGSLKSRPWVHGTSKGPAGTSQEFWFSAARGVSASRRGDVVVYDDYRLGVRYTYDPQEKALYRVLQDSDVSKREFDALRDAFDQFIGKEDRIRPPATGTEIGQPERRRVAAGGRTWTEFELALRHAMDDPFLRVVFRLATESLLPQSMRLSSPDKRTDPPREFTLDYPDDGPVDAYALGVPRTAKFVDRVPPEDLATVLRGMEIGRKHFGSYHAIVATTQGNAPPWQSSGVQLVWRKGSKWRLETGHPSPNAHAATPPSPGADMLAWWRERFQQFNFLPDYVCNGQVVYQPEVFPDYHYAASQSYKSWKELWPVHASFDTTAGVGAASNGMAGDFAYPLMSMPSESFIAELDRAPREGPPGTLLVTCRVTGNVQFAQCRWRYWVDPQHSFATLQCAVDGGPKDSFDTMHVMERMEQTPTGIWYPTMVRVKHMAHAQKPGEQPQPMRDYVLWFYLDFKADLPDRLFEPRDR